MQKGNNVSCTKMLSGSSLDEVPNVLMRLRLDSDEGDEAMSAKAEGDVSTESPQNIQTTGNIVYSRPRRVRTFVCDEEQPSSSQGRNGETSLSSDNRLPGNSANPLYLEVRPQSNGALNINIPAHRLSTTNYNWQGSKVTMRERFAFLFNNEILSDVSFLVGRGAQQQRIPAHKLILSSGSAVFDAMFNGTLATASAEIEVPDVEPAAFLAVLLFLYTDEIQIDPETVMTTLYTAKKYAVSPLEKHCVDFLRSNLTSDNAFLLLTQARLFDEPQLAAVCLDTIDKFTTDALNADGFVDIDIDTLMVVLDRDTLRVRESRIFQAVVRWSEAECARQQLSVTSENQRSVLGKALSLIRFPLMSVEEFAAGPAQSGLLTDHEVVSLFLYFTSSIKPSIGFKAVSRWRMTSKEQIVCRFQQSEKRWGYSSTSNRIRFSIDRRIFLIGYGVYGSIHGPAEYKVLIELIHAASGKVIASNDISFNCDGSNYIYQLLFKEPAEILPNNTYTASATFKGPDSLYGTKGLRKVIVECGSTHEKVKFQINYATGNNTDMPVEDGQIPELIFYA